VYDAVGNRTQKVSTLPGYPGGLSNYNANDELATDTYDAAGNTTASQGLGYVYDFENHLVQAGAGISFVYDGDGNRVQKTVAGVVTRYQVAVGAFAFNASGFFSHEAIELRFVGARANRGTSPRISAAHRSRIAKLEKQNRQRQC
jgi:YD repeat-containing protein